MMFVPSLTQWVTSQVAIGHDGFVNLFLFRKGKTMIAIDSGYRPRVVRTSLRRLKIDPASVSHLFLTHSDFDHAGALSVFPNAKLYVGKGEQPMIAGAMPRAPRHFNKPLPRPAEWVADGETVDADGISVYAVATPGHTPGSTSWLVEGRHLFVGDALTLLFGKVRIMPAFINMDTGTHRESIRMLAARMLASGGDDPLRGVKCLYTAHSGYTMEAGRAMRGWLAP